MDSSELIERLKACRVKLEGYGETAGLQLRLVKSEFDAIIAALQFAEDVERLKKSGSVRFMASRVGGILCQCILYRTTTTDGDERETVKGRGDDIYTAARKAVEALRAAKEGA